MALSLGLPKGLPEELATLAVRRYLLIM